MLMITSVFFTVSACKTQKAAKLPKSYLEFYKTNFQSSITLQKFVVNSNQLNGMAHLSAVINDENLNRIPGTLRINGVDYEFNQEWQMNTTKSELIVPTFGQNNVISYTPEASSTPLFTTELYVPADIYLEGTGRDSVSAGFKIHYNADASNILGLICTVKFEPNFPQNHARFGNKKSVENVAFVEIDNGVFALPDDLLKGIPKGSICEISLIRGAYKSVEIEGNTISIVAFCSSSTHSVVK